MSQGGGEEEITAGGGGDAGDFREVLPGLSGTDRDSNLVKLTGTGYDGRGRQRPEVSGNLRKSRKSWTRMTRILGREGAYPRTSVLLFKAVVQAVSLFGLETWVLTSRMEQALGSF